MVSNYNISTTLSLFSQQTIKLCKTLCRNLIAAPLAYKEGNLFNKITRYNMTDKTIIFILPNGSGKSSYAEIHRDLRNELVENFSYCITQPIVVHHPDNKKVIQAIPSTQFTVVVARDEEEIITDIINQAAIDCQQNFVWVLEDHNTPKVRRTLVAEEPKAGTPVEFEPAIAKDDVA
jgi:hypothetical protein